MIDAIFKICMMAFFCCILHTVNWFLTRCCETLSIEHFPFFQNLFIFSFCLDVLFVVTLDLPKKKQTRTVGTCRVYKYIRNMVYIYEKLFTFFILLYWQLILILLRKIKGGGGTVFSFMLKKPCFLETVWWNYLYYKQVVHCKWSLLFSLQFYD